MKVVYIIVIFLGIGILTGISITVSAEEGLIPSWIKNTAGFWVNNQISDSEFIAALQYLVEHDILTIPEKTEKKLQPGDSGLDILFPNREDLGTEWTIEVISDYDNPIETAEWRRVVYTNPTIEGFSIPQVFVTIWQFDSNNEAKAELDSVKLKAKEQGGYKELTVSKSPFEFDKDCFGVEATLEDGQKEVLIECTIEGKSQYTQVDVYGDPWNLRTNADNDWLPTANKFMNIVLDNIRK